MRRRLLMLLAFSVRRGHMWTIREVGCLSAVHAGADHWEGGAGTLVVIRVQCWLRCHIRPLRLRTGTSPRAATLISEVRVIVARMHA